MGLFSTLTAQATETTKTTTPSSLDLPTVVQLYRSTPLKLDTVTPFSSFSVLSYSAVVCQPQPNDQETGLRGSSMKKALQAVPELGVWNCRVGRGSLSDALLQIPSGVSAYSLTVDLSKPEQVEPTLTLLQAALVRCLIANPSASAPAETPEGTLHESATTLLSDLRSVQFGLAPEDEESAAKMVKEPEENDRKVAVALIICAILPEERPADDEDYREKQSQVLLLYHLRRYAAALKANLCFVGDRSNEDPTEQPAVSNFQLSLIWREIAQGKKLDLSLPELQINQESAFSLVYGPDNHNEELIESVLLRNAHYPGQWDAAKDSLWKILAPTAQDNLPGADAKGDSKDSQKSGDEEWLTELRDSVATGETAKTPQAKKKDGEPSKEAQTPNDAAVSDFFKGLLS